MARLRFSPPSRKVEVASETIFVSNLFLHAKSVLWRYTIPPLISDCVLTVDKQVGETCSCVCTEPCMSCQFVSDRQN